MVDLASLRPVEGRASAAPSDRHARAIAEHRRSRGLGVVFWLSASWLTLVIVVAAFAPLLGLVAPDESDWMALKAPIGSENHILGTDPLGRDVLSRVIYGARVSLTVGFTAPAIGVGIGLVLGLAAGYYRGWVDEIIGIAIDSWLAIPGLVILLLFSVLYGGSLFMVCLSLGLLFIPSAARITRAATLTCTGREYVIAARALGASDLRIITREVFPNIIWPLLAFVMIDIPIAIVVEGSLSFLGLSVQAPTPSWGGMISEGREYLEASPHLSLVPTAVMFLTVLSFNLAGDAMRKRVSGGRSGAI
ncbi:ABC transporter permease [Aquamicrobium sp. LC103]|uniref:ABC transporter permease n=1 Tax=Aquamicrobium sp. LC103 TaxID=1120658 RepID=UPI0009E319E7|nr:ABC transporter permease [Aquamicrobium sp. LC103]TKT78198.1 ABC transporter permease [Aquamicrobium sp. LC103]